MIKIKLTSIMVDDQTKAVDFYTKIIGFEKKLDIPVGEYRWITLVSPEGRDDLELALEPNVNPAAKTYQQALFAQGIPATSFETSDLDAEHARLTKAGVVFTKPPAAAGPVKVATFVDTCGNLIQLHQPL
jgi:glyoxylase I family protein